MLYGIDSDSYNKPGTNFAAAVKAGYRNNYVKIGGQNLPGNQPYGMTSNGGYKGFVAKNRAAGADRTGHYWVTGGDPAAGARFVLGQLDWRDGDFLVLDNEALDAGRMWSDAECMTFWNTLWADNSRGASIRRNSFLYGSQIGLFGSRTFPKQWAAGVKALIALYNNQRTLPTAPNVPQASVKGHQFTSTGAAYPGSGPFDLNVFADDAFDNSTTEDDMPITDADAEKIALKVLNHMIGNNTTTVSAALVQASVSASAVVNSLRPTISAAVDADALASKIAAKVPAVGGDQASITAAIRSVFAELGKADAQ